MKPSSQANATSGHSSNGRRGPSSSSHPEGGAQAAKGPRPTAAPVPPRDRDSADLQKVRDLLFGSQTQELEAQAQRLEQLEERFAERLGSLEEDFARRLKASEAGIRDEMRSEVAAIAARLDEHGSRKVERSDLRSMLSDLANRIGD